VPPRRDDVPAVEACVDDESQTRGTDGHVAAGDPEPPSAAFASEQSVLGSLLLGAAWLQIANIARADDYTPRHRLILAAVAALATDGQPHDSVTVAQQLEGTGHLKAAGGLAYFSELARNTPSSANVVAYARAVREHAIKRLLPASHRDADSIARLRRDLAELDALARPPQQQCFAVERLDTMTTTAGGGVVQGLGLDRRTVAAVIGMPNAGKTAFVVGLGVHIAAGCKEWLGLKIASGPVLYVAAEAPGSVKMRARAAAAQLAKHGHVAFYITPAVPALGDERAEVDAEKLIATVRKVEELEAKPVVLVALDTLASCLGSGPENGDGMVLTTNATKKIAADTGACVLLLHHPSKGDASSARGHTSFAAACDTMLLIEKESESGEARTATLIKARDHASGAQLRFALRQVGVPERDSFGDPLSTIVVEPATGIPVQRKRPGGANQDALLTDLERQYRGGQLSFTEAQVTASAKALGMDKNRNAPRNALRALVSGGFLTGSPTDYRLQFPPGPTP
jgi:hypothetical protein